MFSEKHIVFTTAVLLGLTIYRACHMEQWSAWCFWLLLFVLFIAAVSMPSIYSAQVPDATETVHHLIFLAVSTVANILVGSRICTWIGKREQNRSKL